MRKYLIYLFLFISFVPEPIFAEPSSILTIKCEAPKGFRFDAGPDEFFNLPKHKIEKSEDGVSGMEPTFIYDQKNPKQLLVFWGPPRDFSSFVEAKATKADVIYSDYKRLTAIEALGEGVTFMYTFYPRNELGYFSFHGGNTTGGAIAKTFYAICKFLK